METLSDEACVCVLVCACVCVSDVGPSSFRRCSNGRLRGGAGASGSAPIFPFSPDRFSGQSGDRAGVNFNRPTLPIVHLRWQAAPDTDAA